MIYNKEKRVHINNGGRNAGRKRDDRKTVRRYTQKKLGDDPRQRADRGDRIRIFSRDSQDRRDRQLLPRYALFRRQRFQRQQSDGHLGDSFGGQYFQGSQSCGLFRGRDRGTYRNGKRRDNRYARGPRRRAGQRYRIRALHLHGHDESDRRSYGERMHIGRQRGHEPVRQRLRAVGRCGRFVVGDGHFRLRQLRLYPYSGRTDRYHDQQYGSGVGRGFEDVGGKRQLADPTSSISIRRSRRRRRKSRRSNPRSKVTKLFSLSLRRAVRPAASIREAVR